MRGCHNCEHAAAIAAGEYEGKDWKEIPCYACDVLSGSGFVMRFDEESFKDAHHDDHGEPVPEDRLPVSVMRQLVVGLLKLRPELRDVVAWRFGGMPYRDIALAQGVTQACAEKRHRRAMELWPALRALFPRKVAKQAVRKPAKQGS